MKAIRIISAIIGTIIITLALTVVTQTGGIIYLLSLTVYPFISINNAWARAAMKLLAFSVLYLISTVFIIPPVAALYGRVPLPWQKQTNVKPATIFTVLANRHYVKPELKTLIDRVADQMNHQYPGTKINYLDASFPFIDGFRLFPHLSHNDGKKLDLSFLYLDTQSKTPTDKIPSLLGYGVCEEPRPGEENTPAHCASQGYWQYNLLAHIQSQKRKPDFTLDQKRTRALIQTMARQDQIRKIYIEPHLKTRWKIKTTKIHFHGCQAVRHDDHIHIQIR